MDSHPISDSRDTRPDEEFASQWEILELVDKMDHGKQLMSCNTIVALCLGQHFATTLSCPSCACEKMAPMPTLLASVSRINSP